jgi:SAM-dependent methyltransferase
VPREQRFVFDEVAELYGAARPDYPEPLLEEVVRFAGLAAGARLLELGAGTGQATLGLARRGYRVVALEPGENLARIARERLAAFPGAEVVVSTFEAWPLPAERFDLVLAAQSFHWLDPEVRVRKAAQALRAGGALAILGYRALPGAGALHDAIQRAYATHAASMAPGHGGTPPGQEEELAGSGLFATVRASEHSFEHAYGPEEYAALMETQSPHRLLPPEALARLLAELRAAIRAHGGALRVGYVARLVLGRLAEPGGGGTARAER